MSLSDLLILEELSQDDGMPVPLIPSVIALDTSRNIARQTDLTMSDLSCVSTDSQMLRTENIELKASVKEANDHVDASCFKGDDDKVVFFTGIQNFCLLVVIMEFCEQYLFAKKSLSKLKCLILALIKIRMN